MSVNSQLIVMNIRKCRYFKWLQTLVVVTINTNKNQNLTKPRNVFYGPTTHPIYFINGRSFQDKMELGNGDNVYAME